MLLQPAGTGPLWVITNLKYSPIMNHKPIEFKTQHGIIYLTGFILGNELIIKSNRVLQPRHVSQLFLV